VEEDEEVDEDSKIYIHMHRQNRSTGTYIRYVVPIPYLRIHVHIYNCSNYPIGLLDRWLVDEVKVVPVSLVGQGVAFGFPVASAFKRVVQH
jgi:hypothetical protein